VVERLKAKIRRLGGQRVREPAAESRTAALGLGGR
jgi:hypothetical protein